MTDFTFVSPSDEDCDTHVFRRLNEDRTSSVEVECKERHVWKKLEESVGDDWIAYQWLGSKDRVENMLNGYWDSFEELPKIAMAHERQQDSE